MKKDIKILKKDMKRYKNTEKTTIKYTIIIILMILININIK